MIHEKADNNGRTLATIKESRQTRLNKIVEEYEKLGNIGNNSRM